MRTPKRRWSVVAAATLMLGSLVVGVATAPSASANTIQNNACLGVTGTMSTFPVPVTGLGTPNPDTLPGLITLSGSSVTIGVDSVLIGAGVATGLVSASDSLADIGAFKNDGTTADPLAGVSAVTSAINSVKLKITATNTAEGTQTAANTALVSVTFYVTADSSGGSVQVYTALSSPPSTTPDPSRTGTLLVGVLPVPIPLGNTVWTPTGGNVVFSETQVTPSTFTAASLTPADKTAAPLLIGPKINGSINVPFTCWPGTASVDGLTFSLSPSSAIDTVAVVAPPTAPVCASPQNASVGGGQSVTVTPSCTDVNNPGPTGANFTPSNTSIALVGANGGAVNGTVSVNPSGSLTYANDGLGASTDTFQYNATDTTALTSNTVTVNVAVLNNQCTASPSCSLRQVVILPVLPSTLSMSDVAAYGNPSFSQAVLGGHLVGATCTPGLVTLNGQPQTACGALNPITVVNARGTDAKWDITAQVTDFLDGTRGPLDTCSAVKNIDHAPPDNHCIPGDNLGWVPLAQIMHNAVPGDTAAIAAGGIILPPSFGSVPQTPPVFPPSISSIRNNTNSVTSPFSILNLTTPGPGLHDLSQELCGAPANQSGGTFKCDAGLLLAVPASAAAGTYFATLTLTLA